MLGEAALSAPVEHAESSGNGPAITRSDGERVVTLEGERSLAVSPLSELLSPLFPASHWHLLQRVVQESGRAWNWPLSTVHWTLTGWKVS